MATNIELQCPVRLARGLTNCEKYGRNGVLTFVALSTLCLIGYTYKHSSTNKFLVCAPIVLFFAWCIDRKAYSFLKNKYIYLPPDFIAVSISGAFNTEKPIKTKVSNDLQGFSICLQEGGKYRNVRFRQNRDTMTKVPEECFGQEICVEEGVGIGLNPFWLIRLPSIEEVDNKLNQALAQKSEQLQR